MEHRHTRLHSPRCRVAIASGAAEDAAPASARPSRGRAKVRPGARGAKMDTVVADVVAAGSDRVASNRDGGSVQRCGRVLAELADRHPGQYAAVYHRNLQNSPRRTGIRPRHESQGLYSARASLSRAQSVCNRGRVINVARARFCRVLIADSVAPKRHCRLHAGLARRSAGRDYPTPYRNGAFPTDAEKITPTWKTQQGDPAAQRSAANSRRTSAHGYLLAGDARVHPGHRY